MEAITLETIKQEQGRLADLIAKFEAANTERHVTINAADIVLQAGEHYAGIVLNDGVPTHHLILLPGEAERINWINARTWASEAGGELPTRQEQALLYANLKSQFEGAWYWSSEQHASDALCAWCQYVGDGLQVSINTNDKLRARAVRRLTI